MIYQPWGLELRAAVRAADGAFTFKRFLRLPERVYNGWIDPYPGSILRERYAVPLVSAHELKSGYHWSEMVH